METTLLVPNAIIFLYDLTNKSVQVPKYVDNTLTAANETCISVSTQADVDGEVTIKLSGQIDKDDKILCKKIFNGSIDTPGQKLAVSTSKDEGILEINVKNKKSKVSIWADDLVYPGMILVEANC